MKEKLIKIFTILVFTISTFAEAEYRLGVDYRIADNPLPAKKRWSGRGYGNLLVWMQCLLSV